MDCFSGFDLSASSKVFFLLFLSYVFSCISSTTFNTSKTSLFSSLSRSFLSLIDVVKFDINSLVLKSGKLHSFSISTNFYQWSSGVAVFFCFAQKHLLVGCMFFFSVSNICCMNWLICLIKYFSVRFGIQIVVFGVPVPIGNLVVSSLLQYSSRLGHLFFFN